MKLIFIMVIGLFSVSCASNQQKDSERRTVAEYVDNNAVKSKINYTINSEILENGNQVFLACVNSDCESVGSEEGYSLSDFKAHPKLRKGTAVVIGTVEVGVAALLIASTWTAGLMGLAIEGGATITMKVVSIGGMTIGTGTVPLLAYTVDNLNPALHFRRANVDKSLLAISKSESSETLSFSFEKEKHFEKYVKALKKSLDRVAKISKPGLLIRLKGLIKRNLGVLEKIF